MVAVGDGALRFWATVHEAVVRGPRAGLLVSQARKRFRQADPTGLQPCAKRALREIMDAARARRLRGRTIAFRGRVSGGNSRGSPNQSKPVYPPLVLNSANSVPLRVERARRAVFDANKVTAGT